MKKIFSFALLLVLGVSLIMPVLVSADLASSGPKDCCTVRQNMAWKKGTILKDTTADNCADATPCILEAGETIGGDKDVVCLGTAKVTYNTGQWGMICLVNTITYITNWIFYLLMIAVVLMFIIAGVMYLTAGAKPDNAKKAKSMMLYAILGLVVALVAKLIPSVVRLIVGLS